MRFLIIFLLTSILSYSQNYEFDYLTLRTLDESSPWLIINTPGDIIICDEKLVIVTSNLYIEIYLLGEIPFLSNREVIGRYVDNNGNDIRIRWDFSEMTLTYVDMYYMFNGDRGQYLKFCLKKCDY